jgi:lipopolysaccharide transport system ATP-binding protein
VGEPEAVIRLENVSKRYAIGRAPGARAESLRELLGGAPRRLARSLLGRPAGAAPPDPAGGEFWALKGVSFEVKRGEVVGIIGRNGAGKSTLLKILSRITEPTTGRIEIDGRVASLLEVGTGFHPELTGRENVYLNGSILGMGRAEIARKFDEIVAFAEVEKFLDTPVKRYSSGMYVRLAFAVAAHLEPEILIVDEVLAVGDAGFQAKCIERIKAVSKQGRTTLFVTHSMGTVLQLCQIACFLSAGQLVGIGPARDLVRAYLDHGHANSGVKPADRIDRSGSGAAAITDIRLAGPDGRPCDAVVAGDPVTILVDYDGAASLRHPVIHLAVYNRTGEPLLYTNSTFGLVDGLRPANRATFACNIEHLDLIPGDYVVNVCLNDGPQEVDHLQSAVRLAVAAGDRYGSAPPPPSSFGYCFCRCKWAFEPRGA